MKNKIITSTLLILVLFGTLTSMSCKKEKDPRVPPDLALKTGANYISSDMTVLQNDTLLVGVTATKTEDKLNTFNVSYVYDGGASVSKSNETILGAEEDGFSRDIKIITRSQSGTEKWTFTVTDLDGNITSKSLILTVQ